MHNFDKMLEKKGKKVSPLEQKAKKNVLSDLSARASESMGDRLAGLKKSEQVPNMPSDETTEDGMYDAEGLVKTMGYGYAEPEKEYASDEVSMPSTPEECDELVEKLLKHKETLGSFSTKT